MKIPGLEGASGNNGDLRRALTYVQDYLTALTDQLGIDPLGAQQVRSIARVDPPPIATFVVTTPTDHFIIDITNPPVVGILSHQIRTSTTVPQEAASDLITYPTTPNTHVDILDPGVTKYVALRSKLPGSKYNAWQVLGPFTT